MKLFILCFWILGISQSIQSENIIEPGFDKPGFDKSGITKPSSNELGLEKIVQARNNEFCKIIEERNFQKLADFYTQDCWIMLANTRILCGPDAVSDYSHYLKNHTKLKSERIIPIDVFGDGKTTLTEVGFYHWLDAEGKAFDDGKYMVVWKNEDGIWKRHREIFSSSHPTKY